MDVLQSFYFSRKIYFRIYTYFLLLPSFVYTYVLIFKLFLSWWNTHNIKFTILTILSVQLRGIMC